MKYCLGILLCLVGIYSCTYNNKVETKLIIMDSCDVTSKIADCLDITVNPDTAVLSKKIDTSVKKLMIIFTGRAISGKGLLDKEFLENNSIFQELKKFSINILYVDERFKKEDWIIHDNQNSMYQQIHFNSVVHPHYIIYSRGIKQCEEHYLNNAEKIVQFLHGQK